MDKEGTGKSGTVISLGDRLHIPADREGAYHPGGADSEHNNHHGSGTRSELREYSSSHTPRKIWVHKMLNSKERSMLL